MPQQHKGDRVYIPSRINPELAAILHADAQRRHMPAGTVVAIALALYYERPDLAPPLRDEEELPLTG